MESQGLLTWWEDRSDRSLARRLEVLQLTDVFMSLDIEDIGQLVTLRSVLDWITNRASGGDGGILTLPPPKATCRLSAIVEDYMDVTSASQSLTPANLNLFIQVYPQRTVVRVGRRAK